MRYAVFAIKAVLVIVAVLVSIPAAAQEAGDTIFVTEQGGVETKGRLLRLSPDGLALLVDGQERTIPSNVVGRIEKRDSLLNGMLIGSAVSAGMVGVAAGATCSSDCGAVVPLAMAFYGAVGAGIGALIDATVHGYSTVDGPSLASSNTRRAPAPVASLDQLWLRVRHDDAIEVATINGPKVKGRFVQASRTSVTLLVRGDLREIPSGDVRRVTRTGNRYRSGALWGAAIGGTLGVLASASCESSGGCGNLAFAGMTGGASGAFWGTIIGAVIPKHPVVYGSGGFSGVRLNPMLGPGRVGVAMTVRR